jgi:hypothetical protein
VLDGQSRPCRHQDLGRRRSAASSRRPRVFDSQQALNDAFKAGTLDRDFVAVVRFQGPKANGMPELHKLTTVLGVLQDRGLKVALVTDGRMSGASGKVPAAIHVTPEAVDGGPIGKIRDGDIVRRRRRRDGVGGQGGYGSARVHDAGGWQLGVGTAFSRYPWLAVEPTASLILRCERSEPRRTHCTVRLGVTAHTGRAGRTT